MLYRVYGEKKTTKTGRSLRPAGHHPSSMFSKKPCFLLWLPVTCLYTCKINKIKCPSWKGSQKWHLKRKLLTGKRDLPRKEAHNRTWLRWGMCSKGARVNSSDRKDNLRRNRGHWFKFYTLPIFLFIILLWPHSMKRHDWWSKQKLQKTNRGSLLWDDYGKVFRNIELENNECLNFLNSLCGKKNFLNQLSQQSQNPASLFPSR